MFVLFRIFIGWMNLTLADSRKNKDKQFAAVPNEAFRKKAFR